MLRGGHVFVATDAFYRHQVRPGPVVPGRPVAIVHVHHDVMGRALADGFVQGLDQLDMYVDRYPAGEPPRLSRRAPVLSQAAMGS